MEQEGLAADPELPALEGLGLEWTTFIQQQVQSVFQAAIPHIVQQISERTAVLQVSPLASIRVQGPSHGRSEEYNYEGKESKVVAP